MKFVYKILFVLSLIIFIFPAFAHDVSIEDKKDNEKSCENDLINDTNYERFWVQYSDRNTLLFRYITNEKLDCPAINIDGQEVKTCLRKHKYQKEFNIKVCQAEIENKQAHKIKYKNHTIKTHTRLNGPIESIADTGCLTYSNGKGLTFEQNCNDPDAYPFKRIAQNVAGRHPDLIIHVGDYFYSISKCLNDEKCKNRPFGDNFDTWRVDFLDNAEPMFKAAPIIFTRGNHEKCERGGKGWAVLFEATIDFKECTEYTEPYNITFENVNFLMMDSAYAEDFNPKSNKMKVDDFSDKQANIEHEMEKSIAHYTIEWDEISDLLIQSKYNILLVHRPILSFESRPWITGTNVPDPINFTLLEAMNKSKFMKKIKYLDLILSGHTHAGMFFEFSKVGSNKLTQVVTGNSGALKMNENILGYHKNIKKFNIRDSYQHHQFGFCEINLNGQDAKISFFDDKNSLLKEKLFR